GRRVSPAVARGLPGRRAGASRPGALDGLAHLALSFRAPWRGRRTTWQAVRAVRQAVRAVRQAGRWPGPPAAEPARPRNGRTGLPSGTSIRRLAPTPKPRHWPPVRSDG